MKVENPLRIPWALAALAVGAFLAPFLGRGISVDVGLIPPGGTFTAVMGAVDAPILSQTLLGFFACLALAIALVQRQVVQIPNSKIAGLLLGFFALLAYSVVVSAFRMHSLAALNMWLLYGVAFFAVVVCVGRQRGPTVLMAALFAGTVVVAVLGILEFSSTRGRIFGGWNNPNALAGMLVLGFFAGVGATAAAERTGRLLGAIGLTLILFALLLSQSRGGLLSLVAGLLVLLPLWLAWVRPARSVAAPAAMVVAALLLGAVLGVGASRQPAAGAAPVARIADVGATQEQSVGFRTNLFRGAAELMKQRPIGFGLGTYRFEGARSGLTTQTVLAHNTFLQLGVEATPLAPLLLLAAGVLWLVHMFRGARSQPVAANLMRAAVVAALASAVVHSQIESGLYYFGIGFAFFLLLGVGLLLASDSVSPEFVPQPVRSLAAVGCALLLLQGVYLGTAEVRRAQARLAAAGGETAAARDLVGGVQGAFRGDGDMWYLAGLYAPSPTERIDAWRTAIAAAPVVRYQRMLARQLSEAGEYEEAKATLRSALERDPNNLAIWRLLMDLQLRTDNEPGAVEAARKLVSIEDTPYFRIRSIPEIVPLETYEARVFLAERATSSKERIGLLRPALDGYVAYARSTVPMIAQDAKAGLVQTRAGDSPDEARQHLQAGIDLANRLESLYREAGDASGAGAAAEARGALTAAAGSL